MPHKLQVWFLEQRWFWASVHLGCRCPYLFRAFSCLFACVEHASETAKLGSSLSSSLGPPLSTSIPRSSSLIGSSCCLFCFYWLRRRARQQASMLVACVSVSSGDGYAARPLVLAEICIRVHLH